MAEVVFAIPGDLAAPTGGYAYDRQILRRLPDHGITIGHLGLPGTFPAPARDDLDATLVALNASPPGAILLVDGLAFGAFPRNIVSRIARPVVALVHHPLGLERGLSSSEAARLTAGETFALRHAALVIVTSATTARILVSDFGVSPERIRVAEPGTDAAPRASRNQAGPPRLLAVGSIVPRKGYDVLVDALSGLADRAWTLTIIGADDRAPDHVTGLRSMIGRSSIADRIVLTGAVDDATVQASYDGADIFVLSSHFEGFGMVLTEALARGLPIVTTTGGAASDTVPDAAALKVEPGDAISLGNALRTLIDNPMERQTRSDAAWRAAQTLTRWDDTARVIAEALKEVGA